MEGSLVTERYSDREAVHCASDEDLKRDFIVARTYPQSELAGVVTGWLSQEITRRGIAPAELRRFEESSPAW